MMRDLVHRTVDRSISRTLESAMQNKDLLWVRPDYAAGKIAPESPAQKSSNNRKKKTKEDTTGNGDFFTVAELATKWNLSEDVIRKEFENEPGVLKLARARKGKRRYKTLRIPAEIAERVRRRMSA